MIGVKWLDDHTQEYLRLIEEADKEEDSEGTLTKEELEAKLKEAGVEVPTDDGVKRQHRSGGLSKKGTLFT